ncbi:MAG TPA: hypothetical protein VGH15_05305 [Caulobacteraceae bacterium]
MKPKSQADPAGQITCTYWADLMVRESGTDTPDPDDAVLVPLSPGQARPACTARRIAGSVALETEGYALDGRKGRFLIWFASDPNGAMAFKVIDARGGRILFEDGVSPALGQSGVASLGPGVLRLRYRRGYNAACSIMKDGRACWSKLVAQGKVSPALPPLDRTACKVAYKGVAADDPSVILYDVEATIDASGGQSHISPRGPAACLPTP